MILPESQEHLCFPCFAHDKVLPEPKEVTNKHQRVLLRLERSNSQRRALEEGDGTDSEETGYKEERRMKNLPCGPQVLDMLYKIRPQSLYEHEAKVQGGCWSPC